MSWELFLSKEFSKKYFRKLNGILKEEYKTKTIFPKYEDILNAFKYTKLSEIKIVILGQDPYYIEGYAHGLAFSTKGDIIPKSLQNIKKELESDLNIKLSEKGDLTNWAKQGVFLLNTILTVEENKPLSHKNIGWEQFTLNAFKEICKQNRPIVFILWGNDARKYKKYIINPKHYIIESSHPSPLSSYRSFFGSKPFSKANNFLIKNEILPINFYI